MKIQKLDSIPKTLLEIKSPPKNLYFQGKLELLKKPKVAIIGTRRPSQYSRNIAYSLANQLSKNGFVIVSGGAMGTDILAHKGAFPNTISIMANSLDIIYPKTNSGIIKDMAKESLLISEYEKEISAHPKRFIFRNRLIVGIADILIVVEADKKSGSSQTMRIALEMKKDIYVIPHQIDLSLETNSYLESGKAKGIYNIKNFVENMKILFDIKNLEESEEKKPMDQVLDFCKSSPSYEEAFLKFGNKLFEYELNGDIEIINGSVIVKTIF